MHHSKTYLSENVRVTDEYELKEKPASAGFFVFNLPQRHVRTALSVILRQRQPFVFTLK
jgi:hypothetical protein